MVGIGCGVDAAGREGAMFHGSFTALITPFRNGAVDEKAFAQLVEWQIAEGSGGLVPCGTTGESPTLSHDEHKRVVEICVASAAGRVPVIAGLFFGFAFGLSGVGAAVLGQIADLTSIGFVFKLCSVLPVLGVLTVLLPDIEGIRRRRA